VRNKLENIQDRIISRYREINDNIKRFHIMLSCQICIKDIVALLSLQ
jgi:hypothetical protein